MPTEMTKPIAPLELLKIVKCGCKTDCTRKSCSCRQYGVVCTNICSGCRGVSCFKGSEWHRTMMKAVVNVVLLEILKLWYILVKYKDIIWEICSHYDVMNTCESFQMFTFLSYFWVTNILQKSAWRYLHFEIFLFYREMTSF